MAEHGSFFDPTFISLVQRIETADENGLTAPVVHHLRDTVERGRQGYRWARSRGVPVALGTDLWGADARRSQLRELEVRADLDEPAEVIRSATTVNADLMMMAGQLGVIAPGAYADLLVVDGDPLADLKVLLDPAQRLKLIMKGGVLYKDELAASRTGQG